VSEGGFQQVEVKGRKFREIFGLKGCFLRWILLMKGIGFDFRRGSSPGRYP
jgi:hypothetical protein